MGFWKWKHAKTEGPGFRFEIEDSFALKNGNAVVVGRALSGQVSAGETVSYAGPDLQTVFTCQISAIEQASTPLKTAGAKTGGRYGAHFGLLIEGHQAAEFEKGCYLLIQ